MGIPAALGLSTFPAAADVPDAEIGGYIRFESCEGMEEATEPVPDIPFRLDLSREVLCSGAIDAAGGSVTAETVEGATGVDAGLTILGEDPRFSVHAGGQIRYFVAVEPLQPMAGIVHVPLHVVAHGFASIARTGIRSGTAVATLAIGGSEVGITDSASVDMRVIPDPAKQDEFTVDQVVQFPASPPGSVWTVTISSTLFSGAGLGDPLIEDDFDGRALVDSRFAIPAEFAERDSFRVVESKNLPEPQGWLAGATALLALGRGSLHRGRRAKRWARPARSQLERHHPAQRVEWKRARRSIPRSQLP